MKSIGDYLRESSFLRYAGGAALGMVLAVGYGAPAVHAQDYDHDRDDYNRHEDHYSHHDDRYSHRDDDRSMSVNDLRQMATVNGYADGFEHGTIDRRNGESFNFQHDELYQSATSGYDSSSGRMRDYQDAYRQGYARGYSDSYYGRARNRAFDRSRARVFSNGSSYGNNPYDPYSTYPGYGTSPNGNAPYYSNDEGDKDRNDVAQAGAQNGYTAGFERGQYDAQQGNRPNPQGHGAYQFGFDGFDPSWGSASVYQSNYRSYFIQGYNDGYNRRSYDRRYYRRF